MLTAVGVRDPGSREDQHHLVVGMAVVRGTTGGYLADELGGDGAALARPEQDAESPVAGHFGCTVRELTYHWCRWIGGRLAGSPAALAGSPATAGGSATRSSRSAPAPVALTRYCAPGGSSTP